MKTAEVDSELERLLDYLKHQRGSDFTGYKRSSLARRIRKRMEATGTTSYAEYLDHLEVHPDEFPQLFNTVLINVTEFFRDPEAWEALRSEQLPRLLEAKGPTEPIRVWTAGCASGEEAYTLVIALVEALGPAAFQERVKVYATDMDEHALGEARRATYSAKQTAGLPPEIRDRYFEEVGGEYVFRHDLRRSVIFGRHDLVVDAPISHLDLLSCRNTLMYFNSELQARILARFHFALREHGLLLLGRAEMMRSHPNLFVPVDLNARMFRKAEPATQRTRILTMGQGERTEQRPAAAGQERMRAAALEALPNAQLVVDAGGTLAAINARARELFGLAESDVGRPLRDLRVSYLPVELRARIDEVTTGRESVQVTGVQAKLPNGRECTLDLQVIPLQGDGAELLGVTVTFTDVTRFRRLQAELQETNQELEAAYEELQSTNEELETTNEELQSAIEEMETTNEELQSTNEELETMNEELQSTNEELETLNDELRQRTLELDELNSYLDSILTSLQVAVVVLDRELVVRVWSRQATDLWGLRAEEVVGRGLLNQEIGLPVERLKQTLRACLDGRSGYEELMLPAVNRRGRAIECRVTCSPLTRSTDEVRGVVLLMEESAGAADAGSA